MGNSVTAAEAMAVNRRYWDEAVAIHAASRFYNVDGFIAGGPALGSIEEAVLGAVDGLRVVHLQCHFGLDTLDLVRRGAIATGIDYSGAAVAMARALARRCGLQADFLEANVCDPNADIGQGYDLAFTSWGVLGWLPDLPAWAALIARVLRPGGRFVIVEQHPALHWFDDSAEPEEPLSIKFDFRGDGAPELYDEPGTYADPAAVMENTREYFWRHGLDEIIAALIGAGLMIADYREHDAIVWPALPQLISLDGRSWKMPEGRPRVPLSFSLETLKPAGSSMEQPDGL